MPSALPIPACWECRPCAGSGSSGGSTPAPPAPVEVINVPLVANMAAIAPYDGLKEFNVRGWMTITDGMGGSWLYWPEETAAADGYYTVAPPSGSGRYIKNV